MRILSCSVLLLLLCAPLFAQRIDDVPHAAEVVEMAPATLDELARVAVTQPLGGHEERRRPPLAAKSERGNAIVADFVAAAAAASAPAVTRGFRSSFDPLPGATTGYAPADASGAVGRSHVVGAFNNSLVVHDRNGNQLSFLSIYQFWHDPLYPDTTVYDPRVMYDAANDRFVLAMLTDSAGQFGLLLFAVSQTGDPTGTWQRFRIAAGSSPSINLDFTRMAMTANQIVITANELAGDALTGIDIFLIPRSGPFVDSPALATEIHASPAFDFTPVNSADTTLRFLTQSNTTILQYVLTLAPSHLERTNTYLAPVGFELGDGECGQLGSTKSVECDGSLLHYALLRDGVLWVVHSANAGTRGFVVVWKIAGSTAKGFVIGDVTTNYGYPSIAVNRLGGVLVGFSTFNGSIHPSAAYRYIDPAGNVSEPAVVKDGEDWYSFGRWGDYSSTVVDPADDTSFWTLQSYATPPFGASHATWGTWWSYVQMKGPRVRAVRH
ncbi:MAG TPA: hypothetical protein VEO74_00785 [Thermoanaerobaculia bacterium]|nr:hypothetical protein [Thermoanaerobaculia bacterium]